MFEKFRARAERAVSDAAGSNLERRLERRGARRADIGGGATGLVVAPPDLRKPRGAEVHAAERIQRCRREGQS